MGRKKFGSEIIFGSEKRVGQKKILVREIFLVHQVSEKFVVEVVVVVEWSGGGLGQ